MVTATITWISIKKKVVCRYAVVRTTNRIVQTSINNSKSTLSPMKYLMSFLTNEYNSLCFYATCEKPLSETWKWKLIKMNKSLAIISLFYPIPGNRIVNKTWKWKFRRSGKGHRNFDNWSFISNCKIHIARVKR